MNRLQTLLYMGEAVHDSNGRGADFVGAWARFGNYTNSTKR